MRTKNTQNLVITAMFVVIVLLCSWITIPFAVPFTLQTFGIFMAIGCLGGKQATKVVAIYLGLGIVGLPVFSGFRSGIGVLLGNTGGYIIGFLGATLIVWLIEEICGKVKNNKDALGFLAVKLFIGQIICYGCGTVWFWLLYMKESGTEGIWWILGICVVPFLLPDLAKLGLALVVYKRIRNFF